MHFRFASRGGGQWVSRIQAWGQELGFSQIGVAGIDLASAEPGLRAWLQAGFHGQMDYMQRHGLKRARPAELVPGCQRRDRPHGLPAASAPPHWPRQELDRLGSPARRWCRCNARGRDYLAAAPAPAAPGERIQAAWARSAFGPSPIPRRCWRPSWPCASGLGWRGKHTLVLDREDGSMFFLGELFLDMALPPTAPVDAHCGNCSACITACPTQAILAPYRLDAPLHFLPDDRTRRCDSAGASPADRQPHLRLRRLPAGVPLEQVRRRSRCRFRAAGGFVRRHAGAPFRLERGRILQRTEAARSGASGTCAGCAILRWRWAMRCASAPVTADPAGAGCAPRAHQPPAGAGTRGLGSGLPCGGTLPTDGRPPRDPPCPACNCSSSTPRTTSWTSTVPRCRYRASADMDAWRPGGCAAGAHRRDRRHAGLAPGCRRRRTSFWLAADGGPVAPFTTITAAELRAGRYRPLCGAVGRGAGLPGCAGGWRGRALIIWPVHCVLGTWGHAIEQRLAASLARWEIAQARNTDKIAQGQHPLTEQYSAFRAEVPRRRCPLAAQPAAAGPADRRRHARCWWRAGPEPITLPRPARTCWPSWSRSACSARSS